MPDFLSELDRFLSWAATYPPEQRNGEWECGYDDWNRLYAAFTGFVGRYPFSTWSAQELSAILYVVARDNESEFLASEIRNHGDELLLALSDAVLREGEPDAKWQFAIQLEHVTTEVKRRDRILLTMARDDDEYVRRRSLQVLARLGLPATEQIALEAWSREDAAQEWARMMALWALHRVGSAKLDLLLADAERDGRPYLSEYAVKIRNGEVED